MSEAVLQSVFVTMYASFKLLRKKSCVRVRNNALIGGGKKRSENGAFISAGSVFPTIFSRAFGNELIYVFFSFWLQFCALFYGYGGFIGARKMCTQEVVKHASMR